MEPAFVVPYSITATFNAPLGFVYHWCTDFREDDPRMLGSRNRRRIVERTPKRVIWWVQQPGSKAEFQPIRVVWLRPPDEWHLETCGDGSEVGDYKLTPLGPERTRLDMAFRVTFGRRKDVEDSKTLSAEGRTHWEEYEKFLERDYKASLKSRSI